MPSERRWRWTVTKPSGDTSLKWLVQDSYLVTNTDLKGPGAWGKEGHAEEKRKAGKAFKPDTLRCLVARAPHMF